MDALVAYLQMLGTLVDFSTYQPEAKLPVGADMELDYQTMRDTSPTAGALSTCSRSSSRGIDQIYLTIAHGIRYDGDEDTRVSEMPAFGDILEAEQINQVAAYVVSLSDTPSDPAMVEPGKVVFAENCAACHGENAEGIPDFGAPRLSDGIWLKGSTEAQIVQQIRNPKHGVMPAWVDRLGEPTIKQLAVFVHTLGGGQ
jgi:cytochrome c oxidase cbb3-type subunit 3